MIELAVRRVEGVVCLKEIAEHQQISEKYLEAIVKSLVSAGLVIGTRARAGAIACPARPRNVPWPISSGRRRAPCPR